MEQIEVVIKSHSLQDEEEISESSLQLASLMEEESSEGSEEELTSWGVIEEKTSPLMTLGGKDRDWRGDDRECGNDATCCLIVTETTCWKAARKVDHSLTLNQDA